MDSNGDRETDFSLWDMHPETGTFRVRVCPQKTVPYKQEGRLALPPSPRASVGSVVTPPRLLARFWRALGRRDPALVWGSNQNDRDSQALPLGNPSSEEGAQP